MSLRTLRRLLPWYEPLDLRFARRECVIVPQTSTRVAIHADVHFLASSRNAATVIEDAVLVWQPRGRGRPPLRRSPWGRAVIDGRFRYPPRPLDIPATSTEATLTFTDPLIPHGQAPPPRESRLVLELALRGGRTIRRDLWRVRMRSWDEAAEIEWAVPQRP